MSSPATQAATQVQFSAEPAEPRKGSNLYRVKLTSADGTPVTGAQVSVRSYLPGMPDMGMAAMNVVTSLGEKGGGMYEGQANLESDGTWQLTVTAIKGGTVLLSKQLSPNAEGGK
jgi:Cu(I)/Ag(I) efflux system membrane fusion protein/cobalt-zinc-cadmium efflux system membrane fusion protein